jgi:hypothetical protein
MGGKLRLRGVDFRKRSLARLEVGRAFRGQAQAARAAMEQADPQAPLHLGDGFADRGGRQAQPRGGKREASRLDHLYEGDDPLTVRPHIARPIVEFSSTVIRELVATFSIQSGIYRSRQPMRSVANGRR